MMKLLFRLDVILVSLCTAWTGESCTEGDVRLVGGGNEFEGRVEVCFEGEWGTVCGDLSSWSSNDALVVCKQLFSSDLALRGFFGEGSGTILSVRCTGAETRLDECTISNQTTGCSHSQDAGALCGDPNCTEGEVRLFNQSSDGVVMGQVELCRSSPQRESGFRTKVCDTDWDDRDAEVVCRQLGLPSANATAAGRRVFGEGGVVMYYDNVTCVGTESKLNECQSIYHTSPRLDCGYAGVFCQTDVISTVTTVAAGENRQTSVTTTIVTQQSILITTTTVATVMPTVTTTAGGTIRTSVSSSTVTDPTTATPTSSPSPFLAGILGAVGALVVVLIVAIVATIIVVIILRRKGKTRKREIEQRPENGGIDTLENPVYQTTRTRTREETHRNDNLVPNPLYISMGTTLPQSHTPGTDSPQVLTYRP